MPFKVSTSESVAQFVAKCKDYGFSFAVKGESVVTVSKQFVAGNSEAYCDAENEAFNIMALCPRTQLGSQWGTTSDGIGGHVGLTGGYMTLNKSGVSKRFIAALRKAVR